MESKDFSQFYRDNVDKVYRFILLKVNSSELAQDLTSDAFLRTWKYFNSKTNHLRDARAFVYRVSRNLIIDWYRSKDIKRVFPLDDPALEAGPGAPVVEPLIDYQLAVQSDVEAVKKAIESMRPEHGEVVLLHYLNDLSIEEIADIYREQEGTIRVWLHRGLDELRALGLDQN
jgi:RNA polymerase sigma-70 factor (ECF subfamily)